MKTQTIYVFSGFSGSGKDTAASFLKGVVNVKFASPAKRTLEFVYRLEDGFFDDRVKRQQIAPYSGGQTYLQVLINFWKHRDQVIGSELFGMQTRDDILTALESGKDVAITDMRNYNEAAILEDLYHEGYPVFPIWIEGGTCLESDTHQPGVYRQLHHTTNTAFQLANHGTLEEFERTLLSLAPIQGTCYDVRDGGSTLPNP